MWNQKNQQEAKEVNADKRTTWNCSLGYLLPQVLQPVQADFPLDQQLVGGLLPSPYLHHETGHRGIKAVGH